MPLLKFQMQFLQKDTPGATVTIRIPKAKKVPHTRIPKDQKKIFYFMQIGNNAKRKSLMVIDILRKAGIPVHQALSREKLSTQLQYAQRLKVPYIRSLLWHLAKFYLF